LGEAASVAVVATSVIGFSTFIAGVAMTVSGMTLGGTYVDSAPPPNLGDLVAVQVAGGIGLIGLGALLTASSIGALADVRYARTVAAVVAGLAALLAAVGSILLATETNRDWVLAGALGVAALVLAVAGVVVGRRTG